MSEKQRRVVRSPDRSDAPNLPETTNADDTSGYRAGDTPTKHWSRDIWIVRPPDLNERRELRRTYDEVMQRAEECGFRLSEIRTRPDRYRGNVAYVLKPTDVKRLYNRAHKAVVGLIFIGDAMVQLDPSVEVRRENLARAEKFFRYKTYPTVLSRPLGVAGFLEKFSSWVPPLSCSHRDDPRCLPFQCFLADVEFLLDEDTGRRAFRAKYGRSGAGGRAELADVGGKVWSILEYHTFELLHVGGLTLPIGFHWNVQMTRDVVLTNGWQRFEYRRGHYANVHPNAYVRGSQGNKVWDADPDVGSGLKGRTPRRPQPRSRRS